MENTFRVQLIEGSFSQEEAREVLSGLLTYKINFHELKNFSHQERQGREHAASLQRAGALKADKALLSSWLRGIEAGKTIRLESVIHLCVEEP
ncbi:hypothetical protein WBJ53_32100 (plasmid) [Spirosoma sp. SC4-14]|uniref:hypothetical protein n=1 Tax=Spirosoma sp. SC4-14 TaxID=3128900 RepID=UPI0030D513D2